MHLSACSRMFPNPQRPSSPNNFLCSISLFPPSRFDLRWSWMMLCSLDRFLMSKMSSLGGHALFCDKYSYRLQACVHSSSSSSSSISHSIPLLQRSPIPIYNRTHHEFQYNSVPFFKYSYDG